jgi:glucokinase
MSRFLLADIGGTNARFAVAEAAAAPGPVEVLAVAEHRTAADAVASYVQRYGLAGTIDAAAIGVAGPVRQGRGVFTNSSWVVDAAELTTRFGWRRVRVVNDFEAIAWSLPRLGAADLQALGGGVAQPDGLCVVLGPGTGLGVACFLPGPPPAVIATEAGHATLAATSTRQDAVIAWLRQRFAHVSAERVLSGDGLVNLHDAVAGIDGGTITRHAAPAITQATNRAGCAACREAFDLFCAWLGAVAGDLALAFGARGGVYIAGGIAPRIVDDLMRSSFRQHFEAKGRFRDHLAAVPVHVIQRPNPAFLGLAALAEAIEPIR